jgi:hypothetical protein
MHSLARFTVALSLFACAGLRLDAQMVTLQDGTPVRLRLMKTVSSADARVGETVDFEVTEPVVSQGLVVIPKGSLALGKVTKVEKKRRFGRAGELEVSVDSVRLADGSPVPLRATREKNTGDMSSGRLAATIAASPILVWVKGKDISFEKGMEATAYLNGEARLDEAQLRRTAGQPATAAEASADRVLTPAISGALTNNDVIQMHKAGLSQEVIAAKIKSSPVSFRTGPQDLIQLKEAGIGDSMIALILEKSTQK